MAFLQLFYRCTRWGVAPSLIDDEFYQRFVVENGGALMWRAQRWMERRHMTSAAMPEAMVHEVVTVLRFKDPNIDFYKRRCVWMLERLVGQQLLDRALSKEETAALNEHAELHVPVSRLADAMTTFMGECAPAEHVDLCRASFGHANSKVDSFKDFVT
jgi:hypothetical protein